MIRQASVEQIRHQELPRENSLIVIAMRHYPRGVKKEWSDEFRQILAPDPELFREWKNLEGIVGHEEAFKLAHYEEKFTLTPTALYLLKMYAEASHGKDIYLACQCKIGDRCHREILLLIAEKKYGALVDKIYNDYPVFSARIIGLNDEIKLW